MDTCMECTLRMVKVPDPRELKFQAIESHQTWVLGPGLRSPARAVHTTSEHLSSHSHPLKFSPLGSSINPYAL